MGSGLRSRCRKVGARRLRAGGVGGAQPSCSVGRGWGCSAQLQCPLDDPPLTAPARQRDLSPHPQLPAALAHTLPPVRRPPAQPRLSVDPHHQWALEVDTPSGHQPHAAAGRALHAPPQRRLLPQAGLHCANRRCADVPGARGDATVRARMRERLDTRRPAAQVQAPTAGGGEPAVP
jgi:hypothetical protein